MWRDLRSRELRFYRLFLIPEGFQGKMVISGDSADAWKMTLILSWLIRGNKRLVLCSLMFEEMRSYGNQEGKQENAGCDKGQGSKACGVRGKGI